MVEVSIYMPTKNRADMMLRAVGSVTAQTHGDWELIIVDDASDDATPRLLAELTARDSRIRYIRHDRSQGACAARNTAIAEANGTYVTGLDDDDLFLPTRIEDMLGAAKRGAAIVTCCDLLWSRKKVSKIVRPARISYRMMLFRNYIGNQMLTRREHMLALGGFDTSLSAWQDYDMFLRLIREYGDAVAVRSLNQIVFANDHIARITTNSAKQAQGMARFFEKHEKDMNARQRHVHIARQKSLTSRAPALLHAALGIEIARPGVGELVRIAKTRPTLPPEGVRGS